MAVLGEPQRLEISAYTPIYITPLDLLARVYNKAAGRSCHSWNPTRPAKDDMLAGRFDRLTKVDSPYLYAAFAPSEYGAETAIWETLRPLLQWDDSRKRQVILLSELAARSLQHFSVRDEVTLASLVEVEDCRALNAPEEVSYSPERPVTRRWGHYFQSKLDEGVAGLAYHSTRATQGRGPSVVLWEKRFGSNRFDPQSADLPLAFGPGRKLVNGVLNRHEVLIVARIL